MLTGTKEYVTRTNISMSNLVIMKLHHSFDELVAEILELHLRPGHFGQLAEVDDLVKRSRRRLANQDQRFVMFVLI
jgi:hypothetical protein